MFLKDIHILVASAIRIAIVELNSGSTTSSSQQKASKLGHPDLFLFVYQTESMEVEVLLLIAIGIENTTNNTRNLL